MVGAMVVHKNRATTNSKSLMREPVVARAMLKGTTQGNVNKERDQREIKLAQDRSLGNQQVANKFLTNHNTFLANQEEANKSLANQEGANKFVCNQERVNLALEDHMAMLIQIV
jgi:hypothetical protein